MNNGYFNSPTYGKLTIDKMRRHIRSFMEEEPNNRYSIVIGSDSQPKTGELIDFITAVVIHRHGKGGIYFWKRNGSSKDLNKIKTLRQRIYHEAILSLEIADEFLEAVRADGITKYDVEIHVDIGKFGQTREMLNEVVGMIRGSGFNVKTKPDSYGASKVADRHT